MGVDGGGGGEGEGEEEALRGGRGSGRIITMDRITPVCWLHEGLARK